MVNRLSPKSMFKIVARDTKWTGLTQESQAIDMTLPHGALVCRTGLMLTGELDVEHWKEIGGKLATIESGIQWAIADWWCFGHHAYGERSATAAAIKLPYELGTLMNLGSVARKVAPSLRNEDLSFSHHVTVAKLEPDAQKQWLAKAAGLKWSVKRLRDALMQRESYEEASQSNDAWAHGFLVQAQRQKTGLFNYCGDDERLVNVKDSLLKELVEASANAAAAWREIAAGLKKHQQDRMGRLPQRSERVRL